ncbi:MAG: GAP1-N2 domain-containing protein [Sporichthyaceae bacterium]
MSARPPHGEDPRWVQLTYTSLPSGDGASRRTGQVSGHASEQMCSILLSGAEATLDSHVDLPADPSEDQLRRDRPRRLVHRPFQGVFSALWHTVPAGEDAAGVAGNVFLHAAMELRAGSPDPTRRPIDAWRSPMWLTPWGADAVAAAGFEEIDDLPPGVLTGPEAAMRFLDRPDVQTEALGPLVDALAEALDGGPNVALVAETPDDGAGWIAVLSHLFAQVPAARMSWSTYERAASIDPSRGIPLHLVVFPPADEAALDTARRAGSNFVLIKAHRQAEACAGSESAWAQMLQDFRLEPLEPRVRVLLNRDQTCAAWSETLPMHPVEPLADAIAEDEYFCDAWLVDDDTEADDVAEALPAPDPAPEPEPEPVLPTRAELRRQRRLLGLEDTGPVPVDASGAEPTVRPEPVLRPLRAAGPAPEPAERRVAVLTSPRTSIEDLPEPADLERMWQDLRARGDLEGEAAKRYVHLALLEREGLFQSVPAAAPLAIRWDAYSFGQLLTVRDALLADAATWHARREPVDAAVRVLRLVDFLVRARVASDVPDGPISYPIVDLVEANVPALTGAGGPEVQRACGDLDGRTRFAVLQQAIWAAAVPAHSFKDTLHLWLGISCFTRYPLR